MDKKLYTLAPSETMDDLQLFFFPPYITLAHMFHAPEGWALRSRVLKQFQLQYVLEGDAEYEIEGLRYRTLKGDLLFHGPGEVHQVDTVGGKPYVCISIVFHFGETAYPIRELIGFGLNGAKLPHHMGNYSEHPIENRLSELVHHYRQPGLYHQQRSQQLLMDILLSLAESRRKRSEVSVTKEASGTGKLILIRNYIDAHLKEGFRHEQLEELTGWSRNYVIAQFKQTFGMSPVQYLVWIRLEKAKQLALQSGLSFGQIAVEVGYSDIHAFSKIFKRKTGMSLSQFVATLYRDTPDR
ncbi:AraC family transcriptional regulator [Cohnella endophytica]|uniref:AraC family transcriptional regulator n=1 Tax=Cohnella endophytica TaxID=2419778 RepID=A0A494XLL4_9BACL|nr:AraC family transcriptional regulator [Cohnella endophytica]RKP48944.1 AraC family transcriptional regulator [Cohnella endophytica]